MNRWILTQNADRLIKVKDIKTIYCENVNDAYTIYCELYGEEEKRYLLAVYHNERQSKLNMGFLELNSNNAFEKCWCGQCNPQPVITAIEPPEPIKKGFFRKWGKRDE